MHLTMNCALVCATRSIRIATASFVPDELTVAAPIAAVRRGVAVTVLVPGRRTDSAIARRASQSMWARLLRGSVRIHAYEPCRFHWKVLIVDDWWVSVGSTNFDNRSFSLNDEANLNVHAPGFAALRIELFEADLARSRAITPERWQRRSAGQRLYEAASRAMRSPAPGRPPARYGSDPGPSRAPTPPRHRRRQNASRWVRCGAGRDEPMIALMVEDSALVRSRLIPMLAAFSGVRVVAFAESEAEALAWLRRNRCDLVLLDLSLRGGNGLRLLDALETPHADGGAGPLRVVLTNGASEAVRRHCAARGATAVFDKSIQLDELFDFLRREHCTLH